MEEGDAAPQDHARSRPREDLGYLVHEHPERLRSQEYLRIISEPHCTEFANLDRRRSRGPSVKGAVALREFAHGVEDLDRFVYREPLSRVHECVLGVLALESEPVDPRL